MAQSLLAMSSCSFLLEQNEQIQPPAFLHVSKLLVYKQLEKNVIFERIPDYNTLKTENGLNSVKF